MIYVAGEALVDLVIAPDGAVTAALGGAPFNAARAASRLGADVEFGGVLSRDRFGSMLAAELVADGVGIGHAPRTDAPTTLAAAELDASGAAVYRFYSADTSAPSLATLEAGVGADVLLTGGLGFVLEPMADTIADAVASAEEHTTVMIDVNCRPTIIADREVYLERLRRALGRADIVKVSDEDLTYLSPGISIREAAAALLDHGVRSVLVTAGATATKVVTADGDVDVPVPELAAPIVDTIGAGDTFAGALLAWWSAAGRARADVGLEALQPAVAAAHDAAAVVVTRRGADPPRRDELPADWVRPA